MSNNVAQSISDEVQLRMERSTKPVTLGISNRHLHLTEEHFKILCGTDKPTVKKELCQPGQFACEECFTLETEKGKMPGVRLIGPFRKETQVELSMSDAVKLGLKPPVRDSGKLENTPGIKITGTKGSVTIDHGVIIAKRHIHFAKADADNFKVKDGQLVRVRCGIGGDRETVFEAVLCRVSDSYKLELHLDIEEANAALAKNGDKTYIV
jgi:putative phosphotransacetylase